MKIPGYPNYRVIYNLTILIWLHDPQAEGILKPKCFYSCLIDDAINTV